MDIKSFLETCPIGKRVFMECEAKPRDRYLASLGEFVSGRASKKITDEWVVVCPRLSLFCTECGGNRNFNPIQSYPLKQTCIDLGKGPRTYSVQGRDDIVSGLHVDQFLRFVCGDCNTE